MSQMAIGQWIIPFLSGALAKIERAEEHIRDLDREDDPTVRDCPPHESVVMP